MGDRVPAALTAVPSINKIAAAAVGFVKTPPAAFKPLHRAKLLRLHANVIDIHVYVISRVTVAVYGEE